MISIFVPLAFALIGAGLYLATEKAKAAELGKWAYFVGLFWLVYTLAHSTLRLSV